MSRWVTTTPRRRSPSGVTIMLNQRCTAGEWQGYSIVKLLRVPARTAWTPS